LDQLRNHNSELWSSLTAFPAQVCSQPARYSDHEVRQVSSSLLAYISAATVSGTRTREQCERRQGQMRAGRPHFCVRHGPCMHDSAACTSDAPAYAHPEVFSGLARSMRRRLALGDASSPAPAAVSAAAAAGPPAGQPRQRLQVQRQLVRAGVAAAAAGACAPPLNPRMAARELLPSQGMQLPAFPQGVAQAPDQSGLSAAACLNVMLARVMHSSAQRGQWQQHAAELNRKLEVERNCSRAKDAHQ
jgi:hypothetical protein